MTPADFPAFYQAVHGYPPFPWQVRLLEQVVADGWPSVLALPTASGKTSTLDIALFSMAMEAGKPLHERRSPLRVFFVIDRRLVVDQAYSHAEKIRKALDNSEVSIVREIGQALSAFGGPSPLHVTAMRGGIYRDNTWVRMPNQPTVCVSTVDQVGSRVLFRGYGVSEFARPIHAALTGNDALYILDEAHLSQPFLETLRALQRFRTEPWATAHVGGPFQITEMSATPQSEAVPFSLSREDFDHPVLKRRFDSLKPVTLHEPAKFEAEVSEFAKQLLKKGVKVIGVVVNRVASAREIFRQMPGEPMVDKVLLTGRIRPWDRDGLLANCLDRMKAGRERSNEDKPFVVVATMTVEVGADLDFDFLITEAAPLSSLKQRFGRLDRLGYLGSAGGAIFLRKNKQLDPIYGDDLTKTWEWLKLVEEKHALDFGVNALNRLVAVSAEDNPAPTSETKHAPVLLPAHLDSLVQTSPEPEPTPDVAPFLHGPEALDMADVQVVWRGDLTSDNQEEWLQIVAAAVPRSREALSLPMPAVRSWLAAQQTTVSDIEGVAAPDVEVPTGKSALRWRGPDPELSGVVSLGQLRPGDTLVVPAEYGGADMFGWDPESSSPVEDVGDLVVNEMANLAPGDQKRLIRLRLYEGLDFLPASALSLRRLFLDGDDSKEARAELMRELGSFPFEDTLTAAVAKQLAVSPRIDVYPAGLVVSSRASAGFAGGESQAVDDDDSTDVDDSSSLRAGFLQPSAVTLESHCKGVTEWVERFAKGLGLPAELRIELERSAGLHDIGKADIRFQTLLYGDEPDTVLLAKSGSDFSVAKFEAIRNYAQLPHGFRHEFVSVVLARQLERSPSTLAEYLIGTHHGRGRPWVPVISENSKEPVSLNWEEQQISASPKHDLWRLESGWVERFWSLTRTYGYWGLAYLETLLRLADANRSHEEQMR